MSEGTGTIDGGAQGAGVQPGQQGPQSPQGSQGAGVQPGQQGTPATGQEQPWYSSYDEDTRGWLENRGLTKKSRDEAVPELIKGFRNAERKFNAPTSRVVVLPEDMTNPESMAPVYAALGRPNAPTDYKLSTDEADAEVVAWAGKLFHETGLSQAQAEKVYNGFAQLLADTVANEEAAREREHAAKMADLKREWGAGYEANLQAAISAAHQFGATPEEIERMRSGKVPAATIKFFANLAAKVGDHDFKGGDGGSGVLSPLAAKAKIEELKRDAGFRQKKLSGDYEANRQWNELHRIAYPGQLSG